MKKKRTQNAVVIKIELVYEKNIRVHPHPLILFILKSKFLEFRGVKIRFYFILNEIAGEIVLKMLPFLYPHSSYILLINKRETGS